MNGAPGVVIFVNSGGARVRPMSDKVVKIRTKFDKEAEFVQPGRAVTISAHVDRYLVIGKADDAQWEKYGIKVKAEENMIKLEPGHRLMHGGELRTVISVTDKKAILCNDAGQEFTEKRSVNQIFFTDISTGLMHIFNEQERASHLQTFLATRKAPEQSGEQQQTGAEENDGDMSKKAKATKGKAGKNGASKSTTKAASNGEGRKDFIWGLLDGKLTKREITDKVIAKFGGDKAAILKRVNDAPFYMRKAGLEPAWKDEPSSKADAKKD